MNFYCAILYVGLCFFRGVSLGFELIQIPLQGFYLLLLFFKSHLLLGVYFLEPCVCEHLIVVYVCVTEKLPLENLILIVISSYIGCLRLFGLLK